MNVRLAIHNDRLLFLNTEMAVLHTLVKAKPQRQTSEGPPDL